MKYNLRNKNFIIQEILNLALTLNDGDSVEQQCGAQLQEIVLKLKDYYDKEGWLDCRK